MGKDSKIEWTDHTFNPWWGCVKVSSGCKNCYAETQANRFGKWWGVDAERRFFGEKHWLQPHLWNRKARKDGVRAKVFCGSMCDIFEDRIDLIGARHRLFNIIFETPYLDWLLLTKRPENIERLFDLYDPLNKSIFDLHNIWLGASVENQAEADKRIPELLKIPTKIRFLSIEPMLGKIDLTKIADTGVFYDILNKSRFDYGLDGIGVAAPMPNGISWVIVGGESGRNKRPFNPDWARSIRHQCKETNVPFFMKQINKVQPIPDDLMIREFPV